MNKRHHHLTYATDLDFKINDHEFLATVTRKWMHEHGQLAAQPDTRGWQHAHLAYMWILVNLQQRDRRRMQSHIDFIEAWFTPLNRCDLCGCLGSPWHVSSRDECYGWDEDVIECFHSRVMLCMSCRNRAWAIKQRQLLIWESTRLINRLNKEIRNAKHRHTEDSGSIARLSGGAFAEGDRRDAFA